MGYEIPISTNNMKRTEKDLVYADECYEIMGLVFEVYNKLGYGHKELFYQKALAKEFESGNILFEEQLRVNVAYKGENLGVYILDFLLLDKIVVEIKKNEHFSIHDIRQIYSYLKATGLKLGLLIHFTSKGVRYKRIVNLK